MQERAAQQAAQPRRLKSAHRNSADALRLQSSLAARTSLEATRGQRFIAGSECHVVSWKRNDVTGLEPVSVTADGNLAKLEQTYYFRNALFDNAVHRGSYYGECMYVHIK